MFEIAYKKKRHCLLSSLYKLNGYEECIMDRLSGLEKRKVAAS